MPPNPCKTKPGQKRSALYLDVYSSAEAAAFANVPKSTVYRAMREGQLKVWEKEGLPPRIHHADLLAWMEGRGFPIPSKKVPATSSWPEYLTPRQATFYTGVSSDYLKTALLGGALRKVAKPEGGDVRWLSRKSLDEWVRRGRPVHIGYAPPRPCEVHLNIKAIMEESGLSRADFTHAMYAAGRVDPAVVRLLLRGDASRVAVETIGVAAAVLGQQLERKVQITELIDLR